MYSDRSSKFRSYYYKELDSAVKDVDEKVEILHGERLRQLQAGRLRLLHHCLKTNPGGDEEKNTICKDEMKKNGVGWIQENIGKEKDEMIQCAGNAFNRFMNDQKIEWSIGKAEIDTCVLAFKDNIFKR